MTARIPPVVHDPAAPAIGGIRFACVTRAWQAHEPELRRFLAHRLRDPDAAEDLLQDVFLKAMRAGPTFCELEQPRAWLFEVARNAVVDSQRRQRPNEPIDDQLPADESEVAPAVDALADCITRILPRLPPADGDILQACDLGSLLQQEYADAHGLTLSATKARLRRARQRLRDQLVAACGVQFDERGKVCCFVPNDRSGLR